MRLAQARPSWTLPPARTLALGVALALALAFLYRAPALWLWRAWMTDPYYTHGALVAALAVGLAAWRLRAAPAAGTVDGLHLVGIPAALALYAWGFFSGSAYLLAWSALALAAAVALATGGAARLRLVAAPLALGALAVPTPWTFEVGAWLQGLATGASVAILGAAGVGLETELYTFRAGDVAFEVTPACSGFQSAVSLLAVAAVIVALFPMGARRRWAVLAAAVPVALALNVVRILVVVAIALRWGAEAAEGFFHNFSGLLLFLVDLAVIVAIAGVARAPRAAGGASHG